VLDDEPFRTYDLYIGENYDGQTRLPILFVFHGDGGNGAIIRSWTNLEYGSDGNAIVVYPNQPYGTWDVDTEPQDNPDYRYVDMMISEISQKVCVDQSRIFGWGLSRGAFFANALGCHRGNIFRGVLANSGGGPSDEIPANRDANYYYTGCTTSPTSVVVIHSPEDQTVAFSTGMDSLKHWTIANGCSDSTAPVGTGGCVFYDHCQSGNLVEWCVFSGPHGFWNGSPDVTWKFIGALK
jgi:polyhydroxybutyrate depolymerase